MTGSECTSTTLGRYIVGFLEQILHEKFILVPFLPRLVLKGRRPVGRRQRVPARRPRLPRRGAPEPLPGRAARGGTDRCIACGGGQRCTGPACASFTDKPHGRYRANGEHLCWGCFVGLHPELAKLKEKVI